MAPCRAPSAPPVGGGVVTDLNWSAFADAIAARRRELRMPKTTTASRAGLSPNGYRRIEEAGATHVETVFEVAKVLHLDPLALFAILAGRTEASEGDHAAVARPDDETPLADWEIELLNDSPIKEAELREQIAAEIEAMTAHYPVDIFPEDSWSPDAVGARAMRHAYRLAARIARGEDWRES